jgi:hypothetical protein
MNPWVGTLLEEAEARLPEGMESRWPSHHSRRWDRRWGPLFSISKNSFLLLLKGFEEVYL